MIKSMTGFGKSEIIKYERKIRVEIKSVNNKYLDLSIRLPRFMNPYEEKIRKYISQNIKRGKVDCWINFESFTENDIGIQINEPLADAYILALRSLAKKYYNNSESVDTGLSILARNPDIIVFDRNKILSEQSENEILEVLHEALESAVLNLNNMRTSEGAALINEIKTYTENISVLIESIKERIPIVETEQAARLRLRIEEILSGQTEVDESRLLNEVAFLVAKAAIEEEITRLTSHIRQAYDILESESHVGRKLDFLVQEMNREANTIASKSADIEVTRLSVELKSEIDKIREQVQNME